MVWKCLRFVKLVTYLVTFDVIVECDDKPLILTPYLDSGKIDEAQKMAKVTPDMQGIESYSGFFTVDQECDTNFFFWFLPAAYNWEKAPVLLWAEGGPGWSSLIALFDLIGPFNYIATKGLVENEYNWAKNNNILFLDQPVGTGFSYSSKGCFVQKVEAAAEHIYSALLQFFTLFPNLQENKLFLTGQSFSAHTQAVVATIIDSKIADAPVKMNLKGIIIGNPYIDERCHHTSSYAYNLGIIDEKNRDAIMKLEESRTKLIDEKMYADATKVRQRIFSILGETGLPSFFNIIYDKADTFDFKGYVTSIEVRQQIHVGDTPYIVTSSAVAEQMIEARSIPATSYIEQLLQSKKYIVGFFSGQLDMICLYTSLPCVLRQLDWPGAPDYLVANRTQWYVGDRLAGWFKTTGNLFEVVVRAAGHDAARDQGAAVLDLITATIADEPGKPLLTGLNK